MNATLQFLGAVGTVTGSKFLLAHDGHRTLVDCGLYQGERQWRRRNWEPFSPSAASVEEVVLTHAHLDHCGYLPALVRQGFAGPVACTEGTAELAAIVLRDSAHLQEEDARVAREQGWSKHDPALPLYDSADAERAILRLRPQPYDETIGLPSGASLRLGRAGHILGSATALLDLGSTTVLFSGDLGRPRHPLLLPRDDPPAADTVVLESTYGDRTHPGTEGDSHDLLADAVRRTVQRGGSVVIPAFAVDRTELVLIALARATTAGAIPRVPVHVDSPMALATLAVYRRAGERGDLRPGELEQVSHVLDLRSARTREESMLLNEPSRPSVIISASGMASGGRVVHHLRHLLPDRRNTVVLTGFQAAGTRGRALAEGSTQLKMHGRYVPVRAEVVVDDGFSVHADGPELVDWIQRLPRPPQTVYLVHGESTSTRTLASRLRDETGWCVVVPEPGERVRL